MAGARIVVGVDDSPDAQWVLTWAIGEARVRRLPLLIVHVTPPSDTAPAAALWAIATWWEMGIPTPTRAPRADIVSALLDTITVPDDVEITTMSPIGDAGEILTSLARDGDLLVVGESDRDVLSRLTGRSVRRYCQWHTRTAMAIVTPQSVIRLDTPAQTARSRQRTKPPTPQHSALIEDRLTATQPEPHDPSASRTPVI